MVEAETLLRKALTLLVSLPDSIWRQEHELDLQIALGRALFQTQGFHAPPATEAYIRARQLCDALARPEKLLAILYGQWVNRFSAGDFERAQQFAAEMRYLGERRDDDLARVVGYRASGGTSLFLGEFPAAREYLEQGLALYDPSQHSLYSDLTSIDTRIALLGYLSPALACSGYLEQARLRCDEALAESRQVFHAPTLAHILSHVWLSGWCGRTDPAILLEYADELLALSAEYGFAMWKAVASVDRGWCLAKLGHSEQGISLLTNGLTYLRAASNRGTGLLIMLADGHQLAGRPQEAFAAIGEAERLGELTKEKLLLPETLRVRGDLLMQTGDRVAGEASYRDAIAVAQRQGAKLFELRATTSLARVLSDQGRCTEARGLLAPVYKWFTEGFDAPDLKGARVLLDELHLSDG